MTHLFVILKDGILYEYNTHDDHDEIDQWNHKLQELMKRETK